MCHGLGELGMQIAALLGLAFCAICVVNASTSLQSFPPRINIDERSMVILQTLFLFFGTALSAGVGVHTTIASRIHQLIPIEIQSLEYLPFLMTGAFFPDAFYTCGSPETSESAHWPPFIKAAVDYYHYKYPHPTPAALQLKAFVYGVLTHQVADSSWHSIRLHEGLLKMLAYMEFDSDAERAHQFMDTAGDFFILNKIGEMGYFNMDWKMPLLGDLREIFARMGIRVSELELRYCTMRGESALRAEARITQSAAAMYTEISPLLEDVIDDYYLGGLREIEKSVIRCIPDLTSWFQTGASSDAWELCEAIIPGSNIYQDSIDERQQQINIISNGVYISPYVPLSNFGHAISTGNFLQEPSLAISSPFEDTAGSVYILPLSEFTHSTSTPPMVIDSPKRTFTTPPKFGFAMLEYVLFDQPFLFLSEPGTSTIYAYSGNQRLLTIKDHRSGPPQYDGHRSKQQGMRLFTKDLDDDGFPELFISGHYNDVDANQRGEVIILSGERISTLLFIGRELVIDLEQLIYARVSVPEEHVLENGFEQFGSVVTGDDRFIYITSNGLGVVYCYDFELELKHVITRTQTDDVVLKRRKSSESEMFGQKWMITGDFNGVNYLLIGAHAYTEGTTVASGAVYVYTVDSIGVTFLTRLILKPQLESSLAKFASKGVVYDDVLYVSSPRYHGHGAVFKIHLSKVFASLIPSESIVVDQILLEGIDARYTGFGESLEAYNGYLIVGEPHFGYGEMFADEKKMTGRVGIYPI